MKPNSLKSRLACFPVRGIKIDLFCDFFIVFFKSDSNSSSKSSISPIILLRWTKFDEMGTNRNRHSSTDYIVIGNWLLGIVY
jgi:hypothetical protein